MRLGYILLFFLLGIAAASPGAQDTPIVDTAFRAISNDLSKIDAGMKRRPTEGDSVEAARQTDILLALTRQLVTDIRTGGRDIRRGPNVANMDGINLVPALNNLATKLQQAMDGWTSAQIMVVAGQKQAAVVNTLLDVSDSLFIFFDALIAKLSYVEQAAASPIKSQFISIVEKCITLYKSS